MKSSLGETPDASNTIESQRLEMERCRRELDESQKRIKQMDAVFAQMADAILVTKPDECNRAEALLTGEKRLLEIIGKANSPTSFRDALCRLVEENDRLREDFRDLFEEAPIPYVHEGLDTRFIRANRAAMKLLGLKPEEVADTFGNSFAADTQETQRRLREAFESVSQGKETGEVVLELHPKGSDRPVWVQWWSKPAPNGQYTRTMVVDITDRVLMQQAKAAMELTLNSGQIGDWDLDLIHNTSRRSLQHDQCFGYTEPIPEADWGFEQFIKHVHPGDRARVRDDFNQTVKGEKSLQHEFRVVWSDGSVHWLVTRGSVCRTSEGKATRMLGIVMDITASKQAEEVLRETKAVLEFTLKSAQVGDWDLDLIHDTSRRSLRHDQCFGYNDPIPEADWGIEVFVHHVHPEDRSRVEETFRRAIKELLDWSSEFRVVWPDGSLHWLAARGSIYRTSEGKATRMLGVVVDVTERKQTEETLRASEQLARGQVEALARTLDAVAMESDPDQLVGHILCTITELFGAHSSSVWRRDDASGMIGFEFAFENGKVVTKTDSRFAGMDLWLPMQDFWPWPEVFRTGKPSVIEDIRTVPPFALRDRLLPLGIVTVLLVPMSITGRLEGAIGLRFIQKRAFRTEEIELAQALANQAMLAMQLASLYAQSRESAVIAERNRMARDIHDTLAQGFTGVIMQLEAAKGAVAQNNLAEVADRVERASELARSSLGEARRSVRALRPRSLRDGKLFMTLDNLLKRMTDGTDLSADFRGEGDERSITAEHEEALLRITQESLTNAVKHASARNFKAVLSVSWNTIQLQLADDGCGFDPDAEHEGFGLIGMKERVERIGGELIIRSKPDVGTEILVVLKTQSTLKSENENE